MAKEQNQAQQTEDTTAAVETKEDTSAMDAAVKTSEDFDKLADAEGVEKTPLEGDDKSKDTKDSKTKDDSKADDKDTGDKEDSKDKEKDTKEADDTGETKITELEQKALDYGLSEEDIEAFEDEAALKEYVDVLDKVMSEDEEDAVAQADSKVKAKADAKVDDTKKDDKGTKLDDDVDPSIANAIKALADENKELREKLETVVGGLQQQQQSQFIKRFDGLIEGLGKEFADTFGVGSYNDLGKRSAAYRNRQAIGRRMQAFGKGLVDQGLELPDEQELFDLAVNSLHKKKVETIKGLRLGKKTTARSKQRLGRPATRTTGKLTGDQAAYETSRKFDEQVDTSEN